MSLFDSRLGLYIFSQQSDSLAACCADKGFDACRWKFNLVNYSVYVVPSDICVYKVVTSLHKTCQPDKSAGSVAERLSSKFFALTL